MNMNIGTNIKRLRTAQNITQEQLSVAMNVTCAAVSKWERGETYPDITLLQPLAFFFSVTLDELMGYDQEKVNADIEKTISLYKACQISDHKKAHEIICKAYQDYPNDYQIMFYYMWNVAGGSADNDPSIILTHKEEFLGICEKILGGCTDENFRLSAWNMRAKILHAEGKTNEALEIYKTKFTSWYDSCGQKSEQLFAKDTDEYYKWMQRNMIELADFAADKLGRKVFFSPDLSMSEKTEAARKYSDWMMRAYYDTGEVFFLIIAYSFLGKMRNDLNYYGGSDEQITEFTDRYLFATQELSDSMQKDALLRQTYTNMHPYIAESSLLKWTVKYLLKRSTNLIQNPEFSEVIAKYR